MSALHYATVQLNNDLSGTPHQRRPLNLRELLQRHHSLHQLQCALNHAYGVILFLATSLASLEITFYIFFVFLKPDFFLYSFRFFAIFSFALLHIIPLGLIMTTCEMIQSEVCHLHGKSLLQRIVEAPKYYAHLPLYLAATATYIVRVSSDRENWESAGNFISTGKNREIAGNFSTNRKKRK